MNVQSLLHVLKETVLGKHVLPSRMTAWNRRGVNPDPLNYPLQRSLNTMCNPKGTVNTDGSKQLPALLTVECSMYWTLAWRSSGENASLFRALPLYSCYDEPSPLTDVRSPCQFNCGPFLSTITHSSWCPLFSPISSD